MYQTKKFFKTNIKRNVFKLRFYCSFLKAKFPNPHSLVHSLGQPERNKCTYALRWSLKSTLPFFSSHILHRGHHICCGRISSETHSPLFCYTPHRSLWTKCFPGCASTAIMMAAMQKMWPEKRGGAFKDQLGVLERHHSG